LAGVTERSRQDKKLWLFVEIEQAVKVILVLVQLRNINLIGGSKESVHRPIPSGFHFNQTFATSNLKG
jgi:hypothetical protein